MRYDQTEPKYDSNRLTASQTTAGAPVTPGLADTATEALKWVNEAFYNVMAMERNMFGSDKNICVSTSTTQLVEPSRTLEQTLRELSNKSASLTKFTTTLLNKI